MKNNKLILLFILLIISWIVIYFTYNPDLTLEPKEYKFSILSDQTDQSMKYIRDFIVTFDFEKNTGNLDFRYFTNQTSPSRLMVYLPNEIKISNYTIVNNSRKISNQKINSNKEKGDVYCIINYGFLDCYINKPLKNSLDFSIILIKNDSRNIYPSGIFGVTSNIHDITVNWNNSLEGMTIFKFYFGDKYRCQEPCFVNEFSTQENINYYFGGEKFYVYVKPGINDKIGPGTFFRINTYNHDKEITYNLLFLFFLSLNVGILLLLIEEFF